MRYSKDAYTRLERAARAWADAQEDYHRLRCAYVSMLKAHPDHEVALTMIAADVYRAHRNLERLAGLFPPGPRRTVTQSLRLQVLNELALLNQDAAMD